MAIGLASMMGLRFTENFNNPYIAESIGDFWRRWHISLSSWFRDYVFYPLERLRIPVVGQSRQYFDRFPFDWSLAWHRDRVRAWGLLHGFFIMLENLFLNRGFVTRFDRSVTSMF
ncbi:MAG: hypothetical protein U0X93_07910 [Anaerolineales bacterium]